MIGENAMKDKELVQKIHSGNKEAMSIVVERYYKDIFRFCLYMIQSEEDAYDLAQETFLKFIKYGSSYQHNNLKGYLLTIARNMCFTYLRERKMPTCDVEEIENTVIDCDRLIESEDLYLFKESLEKQFSINAEREGYYKAVETEIEVPSSGEGKRKSVLAELKAKKAEAAKQPRKKGAIDKDRCR